MAALPYAPLAYLPTGTAANGPQAFSPYGLQYLSVPPAPGARQALSAFAENLKRARR